MSGQPLDSDGDGTGWGRLFLSDKNMHDMGESLRTKGPRVRVCVRWRRLLGTRERVGDYKLGEICFVF